MPMVNLLVCNVRNFLMGCMLITAASAIYGASQSRVIDQKRRWPSRRSILSASRIGRFAHAALAVALAGCAFGPDFAPPAPQLPQGSYTGEPATDPWLQQPPDPIWWAMVRDPVLTDLERRVAAVNLDVHAANLPLAGSPV